MTIISERLKDARNKKGLTQEQLANIISVSTSVIGDIESGRRVASKRTAARLADFFNTSADYWFDESSTNEYFEHREKYAALDNVILTLTEKRIIKDSNFSEEVWNIIKDAIKIDLKVLFLFDENSTSEYFEHRKKYVALDNVILALMEKGIIKDSNFSEEVWSIIKDAIKIDLRVLLMNSKK
ncbi:Helix-turn-helix [Clostridium amylolyticum]|uniref:Helix-turn-helix n=1 Tax=Clostridium amylolyticum TaxID=1121298 RepID=A0A1M6L2V2_9CLOT|nr:helix-turn-helix transcriptional regulator [Clostridium amylolyticum]SHJ65541.1 Helix-turn-helix [Clostridium amylolyticum]